MPINQTKARSLLIEAYTSCYRAIFAYFRYKGADGDTANDLASSVFERAFAHIDSYDPRIAKIRTWLFGIAHHLAINHWKSEQVAFHVSLDDEFAQDGPSVEDNLIVMQDQEAVLRALQTLDRPIVEIIALKFSGRLTNREIARLTGLSESHVGIILYRSLRKLRTLLVAVQTEVRHED